MIAAGDGTDVFGGFADQIRHIGEVCAFDADDVAQLSVFEHCSHKIGVAKVCSAEVRVFEFCGPKVCAVQICPAEVGSGASFAGLRASGCVVSFVLQCLVYPVGGDGEFEEAAA